MKMHRRRRYLLMGLMMSFGVALLVTVGVFLAADVVTLSYSPPEREAYCIYYDEEEHLERERARLANATGVIYLTFDDGPSEFTGQLLDVLKKYNVPVTFFVTGAGDDALILREYREGHAIGAHTASHNYAYVYSSAENFWADMILVQERVQRITGQTTWLMRFPGGSSNMVSRRYDGGRRIMSQLVADAEARGWKYFDWNIDSGDAGAVRDTAGVVVRVTSALHAGDNVVLQHDVKDYSVAAVEQIIQFALDNGYVFAKLEADSFTAHHMVNN